MPAISAVVGEEHQQPQALQIIRAPQRSFDPTLSFGEGRGEVLPPLLVFFTNNRRNAKQRTFIE